jgi:Ca-activated chloride channel homolog
MQDQGTRKAFGLALALLLALGGCAGERPPLNGLRYPSAGTSITPEDAARARADAQARARVLRERPEVVEGRSLDTRFQHYGVNPTVDTDEERSSVFAADVDTASYAVTRAYLDAGAMVPEPAVRVEEFVNAFDYDAPPLRAGAVLGLSAAAFPSTIRAGYHVLALSLHTRKTPRAERKPLDLVLVIDASGSMAKGARLELVRSSLAYLLDELGERDRVGIVAFQENARVVLELTRVADPETILATLETLRPEGRTNVKAGIALGYELLDRSREAGVAQRIVLCSDGVANSGDATDADAILAGVRMRAKRGVELSTVGFGMGHYDDVLLERLARVGGGSYAYVDDEREAERLFVDHLNATLEVLARDVKLQVEFDPDAVSRWRLLGYENRRLRSDDFDDASVPGGAIGPGHQVTALYEVKLSGSNPSLGWFRARYRGAEDRTSHVEALRLDASILHESAATAPASARLAQVVAAFAEKLRGSYWVRKVSYDDLLTLHAKLPEPLRRREEVRELADLIAQARTLDDRVDRFAADVEDEASVDWDDVPILK